MMTFKKAETIVQFLALLLLLFVLVAFNNRLSMDDFIPAYLVVGIYQLISTVINACIPILRSPLRKIYYGLLLLIAIGLGIALIVDDAIIVYFFGMLFLTPAMALFYLFICYQESYHPRHRNITDIEPQRSNIVDNTENR
ncbi:MAG: hypothetical protein EOO04_36960 [Chitinophagaceae bacterium]|nr:MAG: hypothetical protein EOO04_36960 [Chitinophagaceae bacterium]